jgi:murein DD-endopeptidase MepM/ murein hydrolase activator NlpD
MIQVPRLDRRAVLRMALVFSMLYYPFCGWSGRAGGTPQGGEAVNGMGGGTEGAPSLSTALSGEALQGEAENLEISGTPEPEEYSRPRMLLFSSYRLAKGDTIGDLAVTMGLNQDTLLSVNGITNSRLLQIGQELRIPNQDGIFHRLKKGETLEEVAERYRTEVSAIQTANELFSTEVPVNTRLFIPGAKMDWVSRQEINGDLFIWPVRSFVTSPYGYRLSPFTGLRQFHSGLDIGAPTGTPVKAAMAGRVNTVGFNDSLGNYVVVSHHSGYRTLYAHLSAVAVKPGVSVGMGQRIGDVGSTGRSTGPHLHFTVYKNGVTVNPRSLMK